MERVDDFDAEAAAALEEFTSGMAPLSDQDKVMVQEGWNKVLAWKETFMEAMAIRLCLVCTGCAPSTHSSIARSLHIHHHPIFKRQIAPRAYACTQTLTDGKQQAFEFDSLDVPVRWAMTMGTGMSWADGLAVKCVWRGA